jgi:hypothetical protein
MISAQHTRVAGKTEVTIYLEELFRHRGGAEETNLISIPVYCLPSDEKNILLELLHGVR